MNNFNYYLTEGSVRKVSPDEELAKALVRDAEERFSKVEKLDVKEYTKIVFENSYDALRNLLDAILAVDGYKSYSHEASIAYLKNLGFEDSVIIELDQFRYLRNSSKYYGKNIPISQPERILDFYRAYHIKLMNIVHERAGNRAKK